MLDYVFWQLLTPQHTLFGQPELVGAKITDESGKVITVSAEELGQILRRELTIKSVFNKERNKNRNT